MRVESKVKMLQACPVQGVIDLISKKWALLIVAVLGSYGRLRYNGMLEQIKGISPKTLADTLKELQKSGIVAREAFNEIPPRVEYHLTEDGRKLREAVVPILQWAVDRSSEKDCVILKAALRPARR
jgi:DNA-binding HxlR family transcriptional regulator